MNRLHILENFAKTLRYAAKSARGEGRASCSIDAPVEYFERDAQAIEEVLELVKQLTVKP